MIHVEIEPRFGLRRLRLGLLVSGTSPCD